MRNNWKGKSLVRFCIIERRLKMNPLLEDFILINTCYFSLQQCLTNENIIFLQCTSVVAFTVAFITYMDKTTGKLRTSYVFSHIAPVARCYYLPSFALFLRWASFLTQFTPRIALFVVQNSESLNCIIFYYVSKGRGLEFLCRAVKQKYS